jgi:hypothetical protein
VAHIPKVARFTGMCHKVTSSRMSHRYEGGHRVSRKREASVTVLCTRGAYMKGARAARTPSVSVRETGMEMVFASRASGRERL